MYHINMHTIINIHTATYILKVLNLIMKLSTPLIFHNSTNRLLLFNLINYF